MQVTVNDLANLPHHEGDVVLQAKHGSVSVTVWYTRGGIGCTNCRQATRTWPLNASTRKRLRVAASGVLCDDVGPANC